MAAQILKCRRKTIINEWNENSFNITDKSSTTLTLIEVWMLLNTPLRLAHTRVHIAGTWRREILQQQFSLSDKPLFAEKFYCGDKLLSSSHDAWNSAGLNSRIMNQDKMTSVFNPALCALLLQTLPATTQKWINVRFVCISLRTVPVICVLFYSTGLKFVRHKEGTKCFLCTALTNWPHPSIEMNQCPLRVHQLAYCPCNMRPMCIHKRAYFPFTSFEHVP